MDTDTRLTADNFSTARKRLLQMHFDSDVGHIGGNLSALDAMLIVFHEYLGEEDMFVLSKGHSAGAALHWSLGRLQDHELQQFHKGNTLLAEHPDRSKTRNSKCT